MVGYVTENEGFRVLVSKGKPWQGTTFVTSD